MFTRLERLLGAAMAMGILAIPLALVLAPGSILDAQSSPRGFYKRASALSATAVTINNTAAALDAVACENPSNAVAFLQVFDASSVTVGTTTPVWSFSIAQNGMLQLTQLNTQFSNSIKAAGTTTATGNTGPSAALDCNFVIK